jgi:hypothetical protein
MDKEENKQEEPIEVQTYKANMKKFGSKDVFLASVPRSGNTWMRLLLSDAILQHLGFETGTGGNIVPDVYKDDIDIWNQDHRLESLDFRLIKTHHPFDDSFSRVIYIYRHPAECFNSLYHYQFRYPGFKELNMSIETFIDKCVDTWLENMRSYIFVADQSPDRILFLSYESMHAETTQALLKTLKFIGLNSNEECCQRAVDHQAFDRVQKAAKSGGTETFGFKEDGGMEGFFRQGKARSAVDEISPQTIALLEEKTSEVFSQARKLSEA